MTITFMSQYGRVLGTYVTSNVPRSLYGDPERLCGRASGGMVRGAYHDNVKSIDERFWLGRTDSNRDTQIQILQSYR